MQGRAQCPGAVVICEKKNERGRKNCIVSARFGLLLYIVVLLGLLRHTAVLGNHAPCVAVGEVGVIKFIVGAAILYSDYDSSRAADSSGIQQHTRRVWCWLLLVP